MINQKKRQLLYTTRRSFIIKMLKKAGIIVMNYETNEVYARIRDSTGKYTQYPNFKQGANEVQPDSIRFNFKTQKL
jgi:hypothetical protein